MMNIWAFWKNKMEIIPSCDHVSTIVWMQQLDQTLGVKARWELHKDNTGSFEQIL